MKKYIALFLLVTSLHAADVTPLIQQADQLDSQLKTREALAVLEKANSESPGNAEVLRRMSKATSDLMADTSSTAEKKKLADQALSLSQQAVKADSSNANAHLALAICYGKSSTLADNKTKIEYSKRVKEEARKALSLDPNSDLANHMMGRWNYEIASIGDFEKILAKVVYGGVPEGSYSEAVVYFQKAIAINPNRPVHHVELGRTYAKMGEKAKARAEIEKGIALPNKDKDDPETKARGRKTLATL